LGSALLVGGATGMGICYKLQLNTVLKKCLKLNCSSKMTTQMNGGYEALIYVVKIRRIAEASA
jgi:hypothetical protein